MLHTLSEESIKFCYPVYPNIEALPEVLGNRGIRPFISGEQGNKSKSEGNRGTKAILGNREC